MVLGLTKLYEKANSMTAETIECPGWMHRFLIGKNGSNLRELIEDNEKVLLKSSYDTFTQTKGYCFRIYGFIIIILLIKFTII